MKKISIIAPFFNEEENVKIFSNKISEIIDAQGSYSFEVICIDDGSKDGTLKKLLAIAEIDACYIIIELSRNFGKEAAITAGLDYASGDAVIPIDSDLQDPPELINKMIEKWEEGAEVVLAKRIDRSNDNILKRKTAELFYVVHNKLSDVEIPENVGDFRLMDRVVVNALNELTERQRFMKGIFAWVGFKTVIIEYVRPIRHAGKTKFSGWRLWNFALEGITSFSTLSLRLWTYIGMVGSCISFFYAAFILIRTLIYGIDVPGYASLLVVVLFIGSLQLLSIGVLGEYIGRMYMETKRRPIYIVRKKHGVKP